MNAPVREPDKKEPSKDEPLSYAPKKARQPDQNPQSSNVPKGVDAAPSRGMSEAPDPPWKGKAQRGVFEGDVAVVELRSRLALAPDRIPEPKSPNSTGSVYAAVGPFAGIILVAAAGAGIVGYLWGSAPPAKPPQFALAADQDILQPKSSAPAANPKAANPKASNLDSEPRRAATGLAHADARNGENGVIPAGIVQHVVPPATEPRTVLSPPAAQPGKSPPQRGDADEIALMMKNGAELMANGDIAAARMMFQRAAEAGEAKAAFSLAETYDPLVLRKLGARGAITADIAMAQSWYEKARDMGSTVAPERIVRLTRLPE